MNTFTRSIVQIFRGAARAFQTFPATIASALAFAAVTMVRIQLDYPIQDTYQEILTSLQWALALSGVLSMAAITGAKPNQSAHGISWCHLLGAGPLSLPSWPCICQLTGQQDWPYPGSVWPSWSACWPS